MDIEIIRDILVVTCIALTVNYLVKGIIERSSDYLNRNIIGCMQFTAYFIVSRCTGKEIEEVKKDYYQAFMEHKGNDAKH